MVQERYYELAIVYVGTSCGRTHTNSREKGNKTKTKERRKNNNTKLNMVQCLNRPISMTLEGKLY